MDVLPSLAVSEIVFVAGARPNFMKIAPILHALHARESEVRDVLVHTGQHYDHGMSDIFFEQLGIKTPDVHLEVGSGPHGAQTGRIMQTFESHLMAATRPAGIVVVGDVNSTMACTLVGVKMGIPVAHVEAGLRSFDRAMPEEINRIVTDSIADLLLVSDPAGLENLSNEGVPSERIRYVGNVMIDSVVARLDEARALHKAKGLGLEDKGYALVTLHRPQNVDEKERLSDLVDFLTALADDLPVVFPIHPRTANKLEAFGLRDKLVNHPHIHASEPLGYVEILSLMDTAKLVISDSGGIQEETTFLRVPCVTLRPSTERPITVSQGTNTIAGMDLGVARTAVSEVLGGSYKAGTAIDGWDGKAAERVVDAILEAWT